jgi:hypothetical protein
LLMGASAAPAGTVAVMGSPDGKAIGALATLY